jgi:hypothetical protein
MKMTLSSKLMMFNFFILAFGPFVLLPLNVIRFGITPDQVTALTAMLADWKIKFGAYSDPNTWNTNSINDVNTLYLAFFKLTEGIKKQISANTTVVLLNLERIILDIKSPTARRSHVKVPDFSPVMICIEKLSMMMKIIAMNPVNPFDRKKPDGADSIGYRIAITDAGVIAKPENYVTQVPETSTEFELLFTLDQVGKTVWIIAFYINARGEVGADGFAYSTTIL